MALVLKDRVRETSTTSGTGTITLAGAASGFDSFASIGDGNTTYYAIIDTVAGDWEVGLGTYTASGTTLSRTTVLESSNSDALVNFAANTKDVICTYPADKSVFLQADGSLSLSGALSATGAVTGSNLNISNWDTAYGWGNHASAGYLTSETYTGTVTSVAATVPVGFAITGSPITTTGTLAIAFDTGYSLPTTASQTNWNTAYGWGDHSTEGYLIESDLTSLTGNISTTSKVISGSGGGGIALTVNDGYGNANVCFNHDAGTPEQNGNSGRIECNTDATSGANITLGVKSNVTSGVAVDTTDILVVDESGIDVTGNIVVDNASATVDLTSDAGGVGILNFNSGVGAVKYNVNGDRIGLFTNSTEKVRLDTSGNVMVGANLGITTPAISNDTGVAIRSDGHIQISRDSVAPLHVNRKTNDGILVYFRQDGTSEGIITVSGTTVSYNGGHLARWSQLADNTRDASIVKGTVLTNLDQMAVWGDEDNEQLNCMAVSSVEGDPNVAGVFVNWDDDDEDYTNDMNIAMTGDMVIRIAQGTTVQRGDLLMSAGDGTAKPQGDDIVRSKTIAKVTSTHVSHTYDDGSYLVPCVLMAC